MESVAVILAIIFLLWISGGIKTVRKLMNLADTTIEESADMADQELKRLKHTHQTSVLKSVAKHTISDELFEQAKVNSDRIKSFRL